MLNKFAIEEIVVIVVLYLVVAKVLGLWPFYKAKEDKENSDNIYKSPDVSPSIKDNDPSPATGDQTVVINDKTSGDSDKSSRSSYLAKIKSLEIGDLGDDAYLGARCGTDYGDAESNCKKCKVTADCDSGETCYAMSGGNTTMRACTK